jgi:acyl-CoA hydrolase
MTGNVDLVAEDLLSGEHQLCAQGGFVLVAVDENQRPVAVPPVFVSSNQLTANEGNV